MWKRLKNSFFIIVLSSKYLKRRMIDWMMHPTLFGEFTVIYLEYLTLLMCVGIGDYNHISAVKKSLR